MHVAHFRFKVKLITNSFTTIFRIYLIKNCFNTNTLFHGSPKFDEVSISNCLIFFPYFFNKL